MKFSTTRISPINAGTLRLSFGPAFPKQQNLDPVEKFRDTITQFEKFALGRFFWFIADLVHWKHIAGNGDIEKMTPLKASDFQNKDPQVLYDITHPNDLPQVLAFSNYWVRYCSTFDPARKLKVTMSLFFRILNAQKEYSWIMVQYPEEISDRNNKFLYGLVVVTDISHLKKNGRPMMSILDMHEGTCQQFICSHNKKLTGKRTLSILTPRQIEVLTYMSEGYSSKQIAMQMHVAVKTIDNHRQNMLHKTASKSSAELVINCMQMGYL